MIEIKLFEIRDVGTHIDVAAIRTVSDDTQEKYLLSHAGYGPNSDCILLCRLNGGQCEYDP